MKKYFFLPLRTCIGCFALVPVFPLFLLEKTIQNTSQVSCLLNTTWTLQTTIPFESFD